MPGTPEAIVEQALALQRRGALAEAAKLYAQVLEHEPQNVDVLCYLAMIHCQQGRLGQGIDLLHKAIAHAPARASAHNLLGMAQHRVGRLDAALASFDAAVSGQPDLADAHGNRANVLADLGRHADAVGSFDRALALNLNAGEDWCGRGNALHALGRLQEALESHDRAVALQPGQPIAHFNRGNTLIALGRAADALAAWDRALLLAPNLAEAFAQRGLALQMLGRLDEARESLRRAVALKPDFADAHSNLGSVLTTLGDPADAMGSLDRAIALAPDHAAARVNRGNLLLELGRLAEARRDLEAALSLQPENDNAAFSLSQVQLLQGDWGAGWPNYERRSNPNRPAYTPLPYPRWSGEALTDERLVVLIEQGFGDAIQFCRFVPLLAARGIAVTIMADPVLAPLLAGVPGVERIVRSADGLARDSRPLRWVPVMSLPMIMRLTPDTIPPAVPYLSLPSDRIARWGAQLGDRAFKIGIAWQGKPDYWLDRGRSVPLACFAPLANIPGIRLISLQKNPGAEQIAAASFADRIEQPTSATDLGSDALLDSAAIISRLDLIVSSDTMVPHLAGALGRPVFVALRRVPDWRWLLEREDSPFYPTMRLFRQRTGGDWMDVFARIASAVRELTARG
jgi:tetratricopeptide (TPR) repeat protein